MGIIYKLIFILLFLLGCDNKKYDDPIWHINPESAGTEMLQQLRSSRTNPYSFSYRKKIEWANSQDEAILNSYLTHPHIEDNKLKLLRYTLSIDSKNANPMQFNEAFYEYFKSQLIHSFGKPDEEKELSSRILINWNLENNLKLTLDVSKEFNSYLVEYKK